MMQSTQQVPVIRSDHPVCRACNLSRVITAGPREGDVECTVGKDMQRCTSTSTRNVTITREIKPKIMTSNSINLSSDKDDVKIKSISAIEHKLIGVLKEGPLTRDQLVRKLAVPRTTLYDGLKKLIVRNEAKKYPVYATEQSRGRPQVLFSLLDDRRQI